MTGLVAAPLTSAGTGFKKAQITTAGTNNANLVLRVTDAFISAAEDPSGCYVTVNDTPMWRFDTIAQTSAWEPADLTIGTCIPRIIASVPADGTRYVSPSTTIQMTFREPMNPATLTTQTFSGPCVGSILLSADNFATCIGLTATAPVMSNGNRTATMTPAAPLGTGLYKVRVTAPAATAAGMVANPAFTTAGFSVAGPCTTAGLLISQVYGGGGNSGSVYRNDFIELHNRTSSTISLAGWSVQYINASGTGPWLVTNLSGSIAPGGYYLVQEATGAGGTTPLPTPDAIGTISMGATAGKIALVSSTLPLTEGCPSSASFVDLVGYGTAATCYRGTPTANLSNTTAAIRAELGCADSQNNGVDFEVLPAAPRNSDVTNVSCSCGDGTPNNETGLPVEADMCALVSPLGFTVAPGTSTPTITGELFESGVTPTWGANPDVRMQIGYGALAANPLTNYVFYDAAWLGTVLGTDDQFAGTFVSPATTGQYKYTVRYTVDAAATWTYCDPDGAGSNAGLVFDPATLPIMTVGP
jgi:hypothetical protein